MSYKMTPEEANKWLQKNNMPPLYRKAEPILYVGKNQVTQELVDRLARIMEQSYAGRVTPARDMDFSGISSNMGVQGIASHYTTEKE